MPATRDAAKTKRALAKARANGRECQQPAGRMKPVVQRTQCEGKADCLAVCPYDVFEIGPIDDAEYRAMPLFTRMKLWVHGKQTAYTPNGDACHACGLCVEACPENAIVLIAA